MYTKKVSKLTLKRKDLVLRYRRKEGILDPPCSRLMDLGDCPQSEVSLWQITYRPNGPTLNLGVKV